MPHGAGRRELKPAQRLGLAALNEGTTNELTREQYQQLTGVSRSQAAYDLAELVETGLIERVGGGRSTRYRRRARSQSSQRHWTNERIQAGLVGFCANRTTWPTAGDFKAAGHTDLYVAASRYGGIGFWASQLGFSRTAPVEPQRPARSIRPLLRWAPVGIGFAALLVGMAGAVTQPRRPAPIREAAAAPPDTRRTTAPTRPARATPVRPRVRRTSTHNAPKSRTPAGHQGELVAQRVAVSAVSPARQTSAQPSTSGSGPAPLPAPSGGGQSTPTPLPAPTGGS
jgi:DNA-binding transcriptional ArsR family regulator